MAEKLAKAEWGEFRIGDLFEIGTGSLLSSDELSIGNIPRVSAKSENNGIIGYYDTGSLENARHFENFISVNFFGSDGGIFYHPYKASLEMKVHTLKIPNYEFNCNTGKFIAAALNNSLKGFDYGNQLSSSKLKELDLKVQLPTQNGKIDFTFMENFIAELKALRVAELHAYLQATGLSNYTLTNDELAVIEQFNNGKMVFNVFEYQDIFDRIQQGRRLKKDDQIAGDIPFVMSGVTNTGVVNYISNPIAVFPKNSITMDIFGNAFYRSYDYGMGDDTGAYWDSKNRYTREMLLYLTTAMNKSVEGKYSYGHKLRSSQSLNIEMLLPIKNNQPNFEFMETFISAIQKLVIKDVVDWADREIATTEQVIHKS